MSLNLQFNLQSINLLKPDVDLKSSLLRSLLFPDAPIAVNSEIVRREYVEQTAPVDNSEIVEWMQLAMADNIVFDQMKQEYERNGSEILTGSGDPASPGLRVGNLYINGSTTGSQVASRGYVTVNTSRGSFNIPAYGKATYANVDILAWGAIPAVYSYQYLATLVQWKELTRTPVNNRIRFASSNGFVMPQFINVSSRLPTPLLVMKIGITSDVDQSIALKGRGTQGSYHNVLFSDSFKVSKGSNEIIYNVFGFPVVSSFTLELQPQDNTQTVLDYIDTIP
jgi:hypothetical protein